MLEASQIRNICCIDRVHILQATAFSVRNISCYVKVVLEVSNKDNMDRVHNYRPQSFSDKRIWGGRNWRDFFLANGSVRVDLFLMLFRFILGKHGFVVELDLKIAGRTLQKRPPIGLRENTFFSCMNAWNDLCAWCVKTPKNVRDCVRTSKSVWDYVKGTFSAQF